MNPLWHHTPICMISHPLYLWHHIQYIWYHSYCFHDNTMTIPDISPTIFDIRATVSVLSHPLYQWHHKYGSHHTWHTYDIIHILHEITLTIYVINAQYLWHHNHYIWHVSTLSLSSHPLYWCNHTNCIYEISSAIYDDIISIVYNNIFTRFLTSQPLYLCLRPTLSVISHPLYGWHYTHYVVYMFNNTYTIWGITSTFYDITPHYLWHHMQCIHDITPMISDITSTVSVSSQPLYLWSLTNCMYDITPTL